MLCCEQTFTSVACATGLSGVRSESIATGAKRKMRVYEDGFEKAVFEKGW